MARGPGGIVFVPFSAPGDLLEIEVRKGRGTFFGKILKILEPSPHRRKPECPVYGICGGCSLLHFEYEAQAGAKVSIFKEVMSRTAHIDVDDVTLIKGSAVSYRTRARFASAQSGKNGFGFYQRGSNNVVRIEKCPLLDNNINSFLAELNSDIRYSEDSMSVVFDGEKTGSSIKEELMQSEINSKKVFYSPNIFFQSNLGVLGTFVSETLKNLGGGLCVELYSGTGLFSFALSEIYRDVVAVENSPGVPPFFMMGKKCNNAANISFHNTDAEEFLRSTDIRGPSTVFIDPPRTGLSKKAADGIISMGPDDIMYVSCSPPTLARDCRRFIKNGYEAVHFTVFDLFPNTVHIESAVHLKRMRDL